jgi:hypothetical protein
MNSKLDEKKIAEILDAFGEVNEANVDDFLIKLEKEYQATPKDFFKAFVAYKNKLEEDLENKLKEFVLEDSHGPEELKNKNNILIHFLKCKESQKVLQSLILGSK